MVGTGAIAPLQSANGQFYCDIAADANGAVSGTIYSTRDATGALGGDISVGGSTTAVYYTMFIYNNGVAGPGTKIHAKNGATLDPSSVTPITTPPVVSAPTGDGTYLRLDAGNGPVTGTANFTGPVLPKTVDAEVYAAQYGGFTNAAINAAIQALPAAGGIVHVSAGTWTLTGSGTEIILVDRPITLKGAGARSTILAIDSAVPNTTVVIRVKPASNAIYLQDHWTFEHFGIRRVGDTGSTRASDGFLFDGSVTGTTGPANVKIHHVDIAQSTLTSTARGINTLAGASSNMWMWHIHDCQISNGINLTQATADSILIEHNALSGPNAGVEIYSASGASHVEVSHNNITNLGGAVVIHGATQPKILFNQCEQNAGASTETNNAMIDLWGNNYTVDSAEIYGNNLNAQGNVTTCIQVNGASNTRIWGNVMTLKATTGVGINVTSSATKTIIGPNTYSGAGGGALEVADATAAGANATQFWGSTDTQHESYRMQGTNSAANSVVMRGAPSQGADILSVQNSSGTQQAGIASDGTGKFNGGIKAGSSGTTLTQVVLYSQSLTPSSVSGATLAEQSFTVTGVTTADKIIMNPPTQSTAVAPAYAYVSAANTIKIGFVNPTAGALTPSSGTYLFLALRS